MKLKDNIMVGISAGTLAPVIGVLSFYLANFRHSALALFAKMAVEQNLLSPLLSLCAVINLGVFFLFVRLNHLHAARGVILATFLYGIVIIGMKFVY